MQAKGKRQRRHYSTVQEKISAIDFVRGYLSHGPAMLRDNYIQKEFGVVNLIKKMIQAGYIEKTATKFLIWNPECNLSSLEIAMNCYRAHASPPKISVHEAAQYPVPFPGTGKLKRVIEAAMNQVAQFRIDDMPGFLANVINDQFIIAERKQSHENENNL